ncbi:60S ribosomal protein L6 [Tieghemostelium lacteum]|uniref:60S ribosomal protein L6 n=1 Tax=Tieghemostelium lacteum TaxID=361077 RepID=A0A151Z3N8_TIELA|nr:60S ribosomal protein L6 [Tieghemostelium lacteum]|eukprot:KYQ88583.1 60S ribosomal protein L6 [Tieghemostelium lacteum]
MKWSLLSKKKNPNFSYCVSELSYISMAKLTNPFVARGLRLYSPRVFANRTRTYLAKKNNVKTAKKTVAAVPKVEKVFGKGKRVITATTPINAPTVPAEVRGAKHVVAPKVTLRKSITPGTVLIILAGKFAGKRVVFLKQLSSGLLLITGPFKVNGVPLRRVDQRYVIATSTKVDISSVKVADSINDAYFAVTKQDKSKSEGKFFKDGEKKTEKKLPDTRVADQKSVDTAILAVLKKEKVLSLYLKTKFTLRKGEYPHNLKF